MDAARDLAQRSSRDAPPTLDQAFAGYRSDHLRHRIAPIANAALRRVDRQVERAGAGGSRQRDDDRELAPASPELTDRDDDSGAPSRLLTSANWVQVAEPDVALSSVGETQTHSNGTRPSPAVASQTATSALNSAHASGSSRSSSEWRSIASSKARSSTA